MWIFLCTGKNVEFGSWLFIKHFFLTGNCKCFFLVLFIYVWMHNLNLFFFTISKQLVRHVHSLWTLLNLRIMLSVVMLCSFSLLTTYSSTLSFLRVCFFLSSSFVSPYCGSHNHCTTVLPSLITFRLQMYLVSPYLSLAIKRLYSEGQREKQVKNKLNNL